MNIEKAIRVAIGMVLCILSTIIATCILAVNAYLALVYLVCAALAYISPVIEGRKSYALLAIVALVVVVILLST